MPRRLAIIDDPYNAETPLPSLDGALVPAGEFFVRSHFAIPAIDAAAWRCGLGATSIDLAALRSLPRRRLAVTLECAGNGRTLIQPPVAGAPWGLGAVGTAEFEGVALADVLDRGGVGHGAVEILFRAADGFERSLPIELARDPDVLVAWGMNGAPLAAEHGAPVRLVVPGWYAVASVKWLVAIEPLTSPFRGKFQGDSYVYRGGSEYADGAPVSTMRVRALIARPAEGERVPHGPLVVAGSAWSGGGAIARVEVSVDAGATWSQANLGSPASARAATPWSATVSLDGAAEIEVLARATDETGETQPVDPPWNELGYGNNAIQRRRVLRSS